MSESQGALDTPLSMATQSLRATARNLALYSDKKVIVISKPAGIVSQFKNNSEKTQGDPESMESLVDDLTKKLRLESRPISVHRLDKGTTGALLLAKTPQIAGDLSCQFQNRLVKKTYLALVRAGRETFEQDKGVIDSPLNIDDGRVSVGPNGTGAHTEWELVSSSTMAPLSLLRLKLHTGIKHQLRVHLAGVLKAPILGDSLYSRTEVSEKIRSIVAIPDRRMFLHASHISFFRYRNTTPKRFVVGVTAPLPKDFVHVCRQLGLKPEGREIQGGITIDGVPVARDHSELDD